MKIVGHVLLGLEAVLVIALFITVLLWLRDPDGKYYEPVSVLLTLILAETIRRLSKPKPVPQDYPDKTEVVTNKKKGTAIGNNRVDGVSFVDGVHHHHYTRERNDKDPVKENIAPAKTDERPRIAADQLTDGFLNQTEPFGKRWVSQKKNAPFGKRASN